MPCQTYVLMKKKRQPLTLCGKKVVEDSTEDERLFGYIASEKESCVEQEENRKEEESTTKFDALEMNDSEFTL